MRLKEFAEWLIVFNVNIYTNIQKIAAFFFVNKPKLEELWSVQTCVT